MPLWLSISLLFDLMYNYLAHEIAKIKQKSSNNKLLLLSSDCKFWSMISGIQGGGHFRSDVSKAVQNQQNTQMYKIAYNKSPILKMKNPFSKKRKFIYISLVFPPTCTTSRLTCLARAHPTVSNNDHASPRILARVRPLGPQQLRPFSDAHMRRSLPTKSNRRSKAQNSAWHRTARARGTARMDSTTRKRALQSLRALQRVRAVRHERPEARELTELHSRAICRVKERALAGCTSIILGDLKRTPLIDIGFFIEVFDTN